MHIYVFYATMCKKLNENNNALLLANNQAGDIWAFSAPALEPQFEPAGVTAPAPLPVHNF